MKLKENIYTFVFAFIVCAVCSFTLAAVSEGLRAKRELNETLDIKKNILKVVDLKQPLSPRLTPAAVLEIYNEKIEEVVINESGSIVEGKKPEDIQEGEKLYPLYIYKEEGPVMAYCFPIQGKGLWSTLYGYFCLQPDAVTVRGITFYKHGETPGLGAEIEKEWFQNNFKGKKIWDVNEKKLMSTTLVKGKVEDKISKEQRQFYVDGISGATMTSKGVTSLIEKGLNRYETFLRKIRGL